MKRHILALSLLAGISCSAFASELNDIWGKDITPKKGATSLDLSYKYLESRGVKTLCKILTNNTTLTKLDLSHTRIGNKGAEALSELLKHNSTLTELNLHNNYIKSEGGIAIGKALKINSTLKTLDLSKNRIGTENALNIKNSLGKNTILKTLNIDDNPHVFGDDLIRDLTNNKITSLSFSSVTGLGHYNDHQKPIRSKEFVKFLQYLKGNTSLKTLDLDSTYIGAEGAKAFIQYLTSNKVATTLNLDKNDLGTNEAIQLAKKLKDNNSITELSLSSNYIGTQGVIDFLYNLKNNNTITSLNLSNNFMSIIEHVQNLEDKKNPNRNSNYSEYQAENGFYDFDKEYYLGKQELGKKENKFLTAFYTLYEGVKEWTQSSGNNYSLKTLDLSKNHISVEGAIKLNKSLRYIETLNLSDNKIFGHNSILLDVFPENIKTLILSSNNIEENVDTKFIKLGEVLKNYSTLKSLDLSGNLIGNEGAIALIKCLKKIKFLDLSANRITTHGVRGIANALRENGSITKIWFYGNRINTNDSDTLKTIANNNNRPKYNFLKFKGYDDVTFRYLNS